MSEMTKEEMKRIVKQQREGYKLLYDLETEALRKMTFEDRVNAFLRIQSVRPYLPQHDSRSDDDEVTRTWMKIRERYNGRSK